MRGRRNLWTKLLQDKLLLFRLPEPLVVIRLRNFGIPSEAFLVLVEPPFRVFIEHLESRPRRQLDHHWLEERISDSRVVAVRANSMIVVLLFELSYCIRACTLIAPEAFRLFVLRVSKENVC